LIRAKRVARMAEKLGRTIVPHNTQTGATAVNILQFASSTKNIGAFMEFPWRAPQAAASWFTPNFKIENGVVRVPTTPGMGIEFDPDYLKTATVVARIDRPARAGGSGSG
jgi:L-alanine-DL-glutamate epimerase-like enolase superfamily enzyme